MSAKFDAPAIFKAFSDQDVSFVTVGGVAIQAHGGQRFTQDLDLVIATSADNYTRLAAALADLDARILGPDNRQYRETPSAVLLSGSDQWHLVSPHGRVDLLTLPAHLGSFADFRARAHLVEMDDLTVPIASRADLLNLKRAAGRPQDLADIRLLESIGDEN